MLPVKVKVGYTMFDQQLKGNLVHFILFSDTLHKLMKMFFKICPNDFVKVALSV